MGEAALIGTGGNACKRQTEERAKPTAERPKPTEELPRGVEQGPEKWVARLLEDGTVQLGKPGQTSFFVFRDPVQKKLFDEPYVIGDYLMLSMHCFGPIPKEGQGRGLEPEGDRYPRFLFFHVPSKTFLRPLDIFEIGGSGLHSTSPDKRFVLFDTGTGNLRALRVYDLKSGTVVLEFTARGASWRPDGALVWTEVVSANELTEEFKALEAKIDPKPPDKSWMNAIAREIHWKDGKRIPTDKYVWDFEE
jgi:hypothetical protein